ncbi:MAG: helix-turn-helix transcriptional regulator [Anaerovorax sp.]|nr:helix-turn-helix transcriptional regulator [Anaerovorax sp.]
MNSVKCACKGSFLDKFIQPSVLLCLYEEPAYGSLIFKRIMDKNPDTIDSIDPTGFYRTLKKMETSGLLNSEWDSVDNDSQKRKIYSITEEGKSCLSNWKNTLFQYQKTIDSLITQISETIDDNTTEGNSAKSSGNCCCKK